MNKEAQTAYPLQWPSHKTRTKYPQRSDFTVSSFAKLREDLKKSLELMGAKYPVISTNIPLNASGDAQGKFAQPIDKGVAIYFFLKGKQMVFACDCWDKVEDNVRAVHKTIDAMRGIERWGSSDMMEDAFRGFVQLEAPKSEEWYDILECKRDSTYEVIKANFRRLAKDHHPDNGGSEEKMKKINTAYEEALKYKAPKG